MVSLKGDDSLLKKTNGADMKRARFAPITTDDIPLENARRLRSERDSARSEVTQLRKNVEALQSAVEESERKERELEARVERLRVLVAKIRRLSNPNRHSVCNGRVFLSK
jgi:uncharacterized protein YlxW (UPF0749 family)